MALDDDRVPNGLFVPHFASCRIFFGIRDRNEFDSKGEAMGYLLVWISGLYTLLALIANLTAWLGE